jgi:hypothetical protein
MFQYFLYRCYRQTNFKKLAWLTCIFFITNARAQNNAIFSGGASDGSAFSCGSGGGISPLPIELLYFDGNCSDKIIILNWSTASETNNDFFSIERSENAENWIVQGTVKGSGNATNIKNYSFHYSNPSHKTTYYRLKQTDYNGNYVYSKIIFIHNCSDGAFNELIIYPNPSTGILYLTSGNYEKEMFVSIEIYNNYGQRVYYSTIYPTRIDLSNLSNGIYSILINLQKKNHIEKIVILK